MLIEYRDNGIAVTESRTAESQPRVFRSRGAGGRSNPPPGQRRHSHLPAAARAAAGGAELRLNFAVPDGGAGVYARIELAQEQRALRIVTTSRPENVAD